MQQIAATHCGNKLLHCCDKSPRLHCCCDKAAYAYFVAAICRMNSNQFEFVQQIVATKFCRSNNDFLMSHNAICCSNLSWRCVAVICRRVCLGLKILYPSQLVMLVFRCFDASPYRLHPGILTGCLNNLLISIQTPQWREALWK